MFRNTFLILFSTALTLFGAACQKVENTNVNSVNKSAAIVTNAPPEFSGQATKAATDPNAPKPIALPKGATPTPGIPSEEEIKKQMSPQTKKTPPIPGIPSEEELKRQMSAPPINQKIGEAKSPQVEADSMPPTPGDRRPRKVRKP